MLDALKADADVLFYNIFGMIELTSESMKVTATAIRAGKPQTRTITQDIKPKNVMSALFVPFGAWLDGETPHVAFGSLEGYDDEVFKSNIGKIEKMVLDAVLLFKGTLE